MAAPMDLNVPFCERENLLQKLQMAQKLGYEVVAINNFMPDLLNPPDKKDKKSKEPKLNVPSPEQIKVDEQTLKAAIGKTRRPFRQLSRISTLLRDAAQTHALRSDAVQRYDLIAVTPTDDKTFQLACRTLNVDIITISSSELSGFRIKRPTVNLAMERGIHFEILYAPATRDSTQRKYFISNAQQLIFWCKGKNIILSGGCEKPFEMRGPHDVANLGLLLDLNEAQSKDAVTKNCRSLLLHAESRRIIKSVMNVEKASDLPPDKQWILDKCNVETAEPEKQDGISVKEKQKQTANDSKSEIKRECVADAVNGQNVLQDDCSVLHGRESSDDEDKDMETATLEHLETTDVLDKDCKQICQDLKEPTAKKRKVCESD